MLFENRQMFLTSPRWRSFITKLRFFYLRHFYYCFLKNVLTRYPLKGRGSAAVALYARVHGGVDGLINRSRDHGVIGPRTDVRKRPRPPRGDDGCRWAWPGWRGWNGGKTADDLSYVSYFIVIVTRWGWSAAANR